MPNIEENKIRSDFLFPRKKQVEVYFTTMDLTYAYGQLPLREKTCLQKLVTWNW